jgi:hypothetical protein
VIQGADAFVVQVATNSAGTNWVELHRITNSDASWRSISIDIGTEVPASSTIRLRVSASDEDPQNVIEAGLDNVQVTQPICSDTFEDCNNNGTPDDQDISGGFSQDCNGNGIPDECDLTSASRSIATATVSRTSVTSPRASRSIATATVSRTSATSPRVAHWITISMASPTSATTSVI